MTIIEIIAKLSEALDSLDVDIAFEMENLVSDLLIPNPEKEALLNHINLIVDAISDLSEED